MADSGVMNRPRPTGTGLEAMSSDQYGQSTHDHGTHTSAERLGRQLVTMQGPSSSNSQSAEIDLLALAKKQMGLVIMCAAAGLAAAAWYAATATVWYESTAKILVSQRDPRQATGSDTAPEMSIEDDILANHIEIVKSRRIVEAALSRVGGNGKPLATLPSIKVHLTAPEDDAVSYVAEHLKLSSGGVGSAKSARSLNVRFEHTNAEDAKQILSAIVLEYQQFLDNQLEELSSHAARLVNEAKEQVESELRQAEEDYVEARRTAPLLFTDGSANMYVEKYRKLEEELLDVEIQQSSVSTRLAKVQESLESIAISQGSDLEKLALIDSESLERLGMFASLQMGAAGTAEFQATQPERLASAQTQYKVMLELMSEEQKLKADFGENHPKVQIIRDQINLVQKFLDDQKADLPSSWQEADVSPETLLKAYIGFLRHDLAALAERKIELQKLAVVAEKNAKTLIEFELKDRQLQSVIERKEELYQGIIEQLRDLDTASAFSGFVHELLEKPALGSVSWPSLKFCLPAGMFLGALMGLAFGYLMDRADDRFRSTRDVKAELSIPIVGQIPALELPPGRKHRLVATELTPGGESFRTMRTVLLPRVRSGRLRTVSITSAIPGDGKSTMMANTAIAFAQAGLQVLHIDADMRRPTGHKLFGVDGRRGLSDILTGKQSLEDLALPCEFANLTILPAGRSVSNPAELLQSTAFTDLLEKAQENYDFVLIDAGPVLAVSDPMIIGQLVDGMIFTTRIAKDGKSQAVEAVDRLRAGGVPVIGCIVNTFGAGREFDNGKGYYGDYYGDGRSKRRSSSSSSEKESETEEVAAS